MPCVERTYAANSIRPLADILKARIQTFGVEEHSLRMETALTGAHDSLCVLHVNPVDFFPYYFEDRGPFSDGTWTAMEHHRCRGQSGLAWCVVYTWVRYAVLFTV